MSEHNETLADIVAEMRKRMKSHYYSREGRNLMRQYSDRIEAAHEREKATAEKSSAVGIAAAIQETLTYLEHVGRTKDCRVHFADIVNVGNAKSCLKDALSLLSKPAENDNNGDAVITAVNNAAAKRKALEALSAWAKTVKDNPKDKTATECAEFVETAVDAALAAPPRNCDRYSHDEALKVWMAEKENERNGCFDEWLFAPATEQKGENDEQK
jgi:hypothetical protein